METALDVVAIAGASIISFFWFRGLDAWAEEENARRAQAAQVALHQLPRFNSVFALVIVGNGLPMFLFWFLLPEPGLACIFFAFFAAAISKSYKERPERQEPTPDVFDFEAPSEEIEDLGT